MPKKNTEEGKRQPRKDIPKVKKSDKPGTSQTGDKRSKRKQKISSFEKAKQVYEQIQEEKRQKREEDRIEREKRTQAIANYNKTKKKMNRAVKKTNRKGQPNLNAQVDVLLGKIQKKIEKDEI